ncbi:MAG: amidohydrolase family protein [Propionibacteriaceae bacterium]
MNSFAEAIGALSLVDHHVHGALRTAVDRPIFESMITEAPVPPAVGTQFDSQLGFAIRRWCAPLLDLPTHAPADAYFAARTRLGEAEVNRRLLGAAGTATYLLDTGFLGDAILDPTEHAAASGARTHEVVRLETLAEELLATGDGSDFVVAYPQLLAERTIEAVGVKSILAYRYGFDIPPDRPEATAVRRAVDRTRAGDGAPAVQDPVLLRFLLWCAVDRGLPIQLHCGYGDPDLDLHRANPLLLTDWLRAVAPAGVPVLLLHNYPYHREAGYLAQVFEHVYFDVGLGINHTGVQSRQLIAESLEVAPFHKQLYSSDAWGPAELHYLGAHLWRRGVTRVVGEWVEAGDWDEADAIRVLGLIGHGNAERVYAL